MTMNPTLVQSPASTRRGIGSRPLSLGARVSLAAGAAVFVVLLTYGLALHHFVQGAIGAWERENLAALGHHAADMVAAEPPEDRASAVRRLAGELEAFGVELRSLDPDSSTEPAPGGAVRLPVGGGGAELRLATSRPARDTLGRRLSVLYASLLLTLFVALALAVQGSVYWGAVRPLRKVHQQLRQMHRGPWRTDAGDSGAAEMVSLAREIEAVGLTLHRRVPEWVEAERKAGTELARRRLRTAVLPDLRELNALLGDVLARGGASPEAVRALRRAQAVSDRIAEHLATSVEEELEGSHSRTRGPSRRPSDLNRLSGDSIPKKGAFHGLH